MDSTYGTMSVVIGERAQKALSLFPRGRMAKLELTDEEKARYDIWWKAHSLICPFKPGKCKIAHFVVSVSDAGTYTVVECLCKTVFDI